MIGKILVTGGAGFIGSHTVDYLLAQGNQVIVLDNLSTGKMENLDLSHHSLEFIEGDVLEYQLVEDLLKGCDAVIHLAALVSVQQSIENPIYSFQVNAQGFLHVLEAVRQSDWPIRIVYASSAAVYGDVKDAPGNDEISLTSEPLSPYALQKLENEKYAGLYATLHGVKSIGLRYFNVYGPRQDASSPYSGVISRFMDAYKNDKELKLYGDGTQSRDFIYITDIVTANALALQSDYPGVLNIATGQPQTLLDLIKSIETIGQHPAKIQKQPPRIGDIYSSYGTTTKAKKVLDYQAKISLKEGIKMMQMPPLPPQGEDVT